MKRTYNFNIKKRIFPKEIDIILATLIDMRLGKRFRKFVQQLSHGITENTSLVC